MTQETENQMRWIGRLLGTWALYRVIDDARNKDRLVFRGRAEFVPDGHGLSYDESGLWETGGLKGSRGSQSHLWRENGAGVDVLYRDGRPFHGFAWPGDTGTAYAGHDCAPDRYDATYRFELPDRWHLEWRAKGPAKDYVSRTRFERESRL